MAWSKPGDGGDEGDGISMLTPKSAVLQDGTLVETGELTPVGDLVDKILKKNEDAKKQAENAENDNADNRINSKKDSNFEMHKSQHMVRIAADPRDAEERKGSSSSSGIYASSSTLNTPDSILDDPDHFPLPVKPPLLIPELQSKINRFNTTSFGDGVLDTLCEFNVDPQKWIRKARWTDSKYLWFTDANERAALTNFR